MYFDLDVYLERWDNELLYVFDALFWKEYFGAYGLNFFNGDILLTKSNHPIYNHAIDVFKEQFFKRTDLLQVRSCFNSLHSITPFDVGVYQQMIAYVRYANKNGTVDGMLRPKNQPMLRGEHYHIKYTDGTSKDIYLSIRS